MTTFSLTQAKPYKDFRGAIRSSHTLASSGPLGTGQLVVKQKVEEEDEWVVNSNVDLEAGEHLAGILIVVAKFNRVEVLTPDGTTDVNLAIDQGQ